MAARVVGLLLLCIAISAGLAFAAVPGAIVLTDAARPISLSSPGVDALNDPTQQLSLDDVIARPTAFKPAGLLPTVYTLTTRWYRFELKNGDPGTQWYVAVTPYSRSAELYYPEAAGRYGVVRFGADVPYNRRAGSGELPGAALLPPMFGKTLYLRVTGDFGVGTGPAIRSAKLLDPYDKAIAGMLIGFLYAMCVASLLLALRLRSPLYFWTAALLFASASNEVTSRYLAPEYLWPDSSVPLRLANNVLNATLYVLFYVQSRVFLEAPYRPKWYNLSLIPLGVLVAADLGRIVLPIPALAFSVAAGALLFALVILASAVWAWRGGYHAARFFLLGFAPFCGAAILQMLSLAGFAGGTVVQWLPPIGVALYAAMLQLALADRILLINRDREEALSQIASERQNTIHAHEEALETLQAHNRAFSKFVPEDFLRQLGCADIVDVALGDHVERKMAVLFSDIRSFTTISEQLTPQQNFEFVNGYFSRVGPVVREFGGFIDKFVGDAVMALFEEAERAVDAAIALQQEVRRFNEARARQFLQPIQVGIGIHYGSLMLGTVGEEHRMDTTVISGVVNVASRIEALTKRFDARILLSGAIVEAVPAAKYRLRKLAAVQVKGTTAAVDVYEACDADIPEIMLSKISSMSQFEAGVRAYCGGHFEQSCDIFQQLLLKEPRDAAARYYFDRSNELRNAGAAATWDGVERLDVK